MTSLATAKVLLFIALNVGPHNATTIFATSKSECYTWTSTRAGWTVDTPSFPASDFTRDPSHEYTVSPGQSEAADVPRYIRSVAHHDWSAGPLIFDNGDRIEKHREHAFYIINAGGANEKVYTILFPKED